MIIRSRQPALVGKSHGRSATADTTTSGADCTGSTALLFWVSVIAITALASCLRLVRLDSPSLDVDEFFTIGRCGQDYVTFWRYLGYVPSKLTLMWFGADLSQISIENIAEWQKLGITEFAARLGPAIVGIITVPLVMLTSRSFLGSRGALYLGALLAISHWHLFWSQSARFYSIQFLFFSVGFCVLCAAVRDRAVRRVVVGMTLMVLAQLTQPITTLTFGGACAGLFLIVAIKRTDRFWRMIGYLVVGFLLLSVGLLIGKTMTPPTNLNDFAAQGWGVSLTEMTLGTARRIGPIVCVLAGMLVLSEGWRRRFDDRAMVIWLCAAAALVPLGLLLGLDLLFPVAQRYLFCSLIAWLILAVLALLTCEDAIRTRASKPLPLAVAACTAASVGWHTWMYSRDGLGGRWPWRQVFAHVDEHRVLGEFVYTGQAFQGRFYLQDSSIRHPTDVIEGPFWLIADLRDFSRLSNSYAGQTYSRDFFLPSRPWQPPIRVSRVVQEQFAAATSGNNDKGVNR